MWERQKSIAASRGGKEGDKILRLVDIIDRGRVFCQFEFYKRIRLHTNSTQLNKSELLNLRKTTLKLGENTLNLEVVVDEDQIKSVSFVNLEDSVTTMYPPVKPSLESIEKELIAGTPIDEIPVQEKSKFTQSMLIDGIKAALTKAVPEE